MSELSCQRQVLSAQVERGQRELSARWQQERGGMSGEDHSRPGRPLGELKGDSPAIHELVNWLRQLYQREGYTFRSLEEHLPPYRRNYISIQLNGSVVPEWAFIERLIILCAAQAGPDATRLLLDKGHHLWETAATAPPSPRRTPPPPAEDPPIPQPQVTRSPRLRIAVALAAAVATVTLAMWAFKSGSSGTPGSSPPSLLTNGQQATPTATTPRVKGDNTEFVADVTIPDGSWVHIGQRFDKIWAIRNTGTVPWKGRYLTRQGVTVGAGICTSAPQVPVPDTTPGHTVHLKVTFTAPSLPGSCRADWKMTDARGRPYFPNLPGVYVIVNVADTTSPSPEA
jgi:Ig-like domain from next to BRCA1 gene